MLTMGHVLMAMLSLLVRAAALSEHTTVSADYSADGEVLLNVASSTRVNALAREVVHHHHGRIICEILAVLQLLDAPPDALRHLRVSYHLPDSRGISIEIKFRFWFRRKLARFEIGLKVCLDTKLGLRFGLRGWP